MFLPWNWEFEKENNGKPQDQEIKHCLPQYLWVRDIGSVSQRMFPICTHQQTPSPMHSAVLKISKHFLNNNFLRCCLLGTKLVFLRRELQLHPARCQGMRRRSDIWVKGGLWSAKHVKRVTHRRACFGLWRNL